MGLCNPLPFYPRAGRGHAAESLGCGKEEEGGPKRFHFFSVVISFTTSMEQVECSTSRIAPLKRFGSPPSGGHRNHSVSPQPLWTKLNGTRQTIMFERTNTHKTGNCSCVVFFGWSVFIIVRVFWTYSDTLAGLLEYVLILFSEWSVRTMSFYGPHQKFQELRKSRRLYIYFVNSKEPKLCLLFIFIFIFKMFHLFR